MFVWRNLGFSAENRGFSWKQCWKSKLQPTSRAIPIGWHALLLVLNQQTIEIREDQSNPVPPGDILRVGTVWDWAIIMECGHIDVFLQRPSSPVAALAWPQQYRLRLLPGALVSALLPRTSVHPTSGEAAAGPPSAAGKNRAAAAAAEKGMGIAMS